MRISKNILSSAQEKGILNRSQVEPLWDFLKTHSEETGFLPIFYYLSGLTAICGIVSFMTMAWKFLSGISIAILSTLFAVSFWTFAYYLKNKKNYFNVSGFFATISVFAVPFIVYSLEKGLGLWVESDPGVFPLFYTFGNASWVVMDICLILAGIATIRWISFPFLVFPIGLGAWFLTVDMTLIFLAKGQDFWLLRQWVSLFFGLAMISFGYWLNGRTKKDFSFWLYFFGLLSVNIGLFLLWGKGEGYAALFALSSIAIMLSSLLFKRKVFLVYGAINLFSYLIHLADIVFEDSLTFTLGLIGLSISMITIAAFCSRLNLFKRTRS